VQIEDNHTAKQNNVIKEHNKRKQMETINMFLRRTIDPNGLNIREETY